MKILYVAPRYHTNQVPIMQGWHGKNVTVMFMAQFQGVSEVHDYVDFQQIKPAYIMKIIHSLLIQKYGSVHVEDWEISRFVPSVIWLYHTIKRFSPDVVVIRERSVTTLLVTIISRYLKINKIILYTQTPLFPIQKARSISAVLKRILFPRISFTPVLYKGHKPTTFDYNAAEREHKYFIPLAYPAVNKITYQRDCNVLRLLDIGKYREYKNHFFFLEALKPLRSRKDLQITIIGQVSNADEEIYFENMKKRVEEYGLTNIVSLRRNIPYSEMSSIYADHNVLVLPSRNETAGMVILEAMAEGLCVLSSENCGLACYLTENNCGFTYSIDNPLRLTAIIEQLLNDKTIIFEMSKKSVAAVAQRYSFDNYFNGFCDILKKEFNYEIP